MRNVKDITDIENARAEIERLRFELLMVAKLASGKDVFYSRFSKGMAEKIRDNVLDHPKDYV